MKRKFILLPITLTALAPVISLVGCGDPDKPEPPEPTPTPPTPYAIYSLNKWRVVTAYTADLFESDLVFKKEKIYQIVINYSIIEQDIE